MILRSTRLTQNVRRPIPRSGVGMHRMRILLDDLPRLGVDQSAIAIENRNGDGLAAGRALPILRRHRFGRFKSGRAVAAVKPVAFSPAPHAAGRAPQQVPKIASWRQAPSPARRHSLQPPRRPIDCPFRRRNAQRRQAGRTPHERPHLSLRRRQLRVADLARKDQHSDES